VRTSPAHPIQEIAMTTTATPVRAPVPEIELLRQQGRMVHRVVLLQVDGLSHADSLIQPHPGGNCLNWVLGHLLAIYGRLLGLLGQAPVIPDAELARYDRGASPLTDPAQALDFARLVTAWDETCARVDAGLAALPAEHLPMPSRFSPSNNPNETIGSLLATICWHQAYHTGQAALLRRLAGKPGAIK
jgi:hypothetical protein